VQALELAGVVDEVLERSRQPAARRPRHEHREDEADDCGDHQEQRRRLKRPFGFAQWQQQEDRLTRAQSPAVRHDFRTQAGGDVDADAGFSRRQA